MKINAVVEIDENAIIGQIQKVKEAGDKFTDEILKLRGMMCVESPELERERRNTERESACGADKAETGRKKAVFE